jgi:hypothetical protein
MVNETAGGAGFESAAEEFANAYHYFVEALEVLEKDAATQCDLMGNFNVAWELKDDVLRGERLLTLPGGELTEEQRDEIRKLLSSLREIPNSVLAATTSGTENRRAMEDLSWGPVRKNASRLLDMLRSESRKTSAFFRRKRR